MRARRHISREVPKAWGHGHVLVWVPGALQGSLHRRCWRGRSRRREALHALLPRHSSHDWRKKIGLP